MVWQPQRGKTLYISIVRIIKSVLTVLTVGLPSLGASASVGLCVLSVERPQRPGGE